MIYADIAAAVAVALFIWLVPVRRNGIPGLRGRGKLPPGHQGHLASRPIPPDEVIGAPDGDHHSGRDERILAELDTSREPGHTSRVTAPHQSRKKSA
jgi:hypothetical protein